MSHDHEDFGSSKYCVALKVMKYDQDQISHQPMGPERLTFTYWTCCQKLLGSDGAITPAIFTCLMNCLQCQSRRTSYLYLDLADLFI